MKTYHVEWAINIEADSPVEAAQKARAIQLDQGSIANVFDVYEIDPEDNQDHGEPPHVDLLEVGGASGERWSWADVEETSREANQ